MSRWIKYNRPKDDPLSGKDCGVAFVLFVLMLYLFIGIFIVSDIFMNAIEKICGATRIRTTKKEEGGVVITGRVEVQVWNETVANLSLMALGSSAPEILLCIIEVSEGLGKNYPGDLGPATVVGSAAFNLFIISAVCILALPPGATSRIKLYKVFVVTCVASLWAYIWIVVVLQWSSPDVVDLWEAIFTVLMFPLLLAVAYWAEKNFCVTGFDDGNQVADKDSDTEQRSRSHFVDDQDKLFDDVGHVNKEVLKDLYNELTDLADLTSEEMTSILATKLIRNKRHSKMWYRNEEARGLMGGGHLTPVLNQKLEEVYKAISESAPHKATKKSLFRVKSVTSVTSDVYRKKAVVEFQAATLAVSEGIGTLPITIHRTGHTDVGFQIKVESYDGSAQNGKQYDGVSEIVTFDPYVKEQVVNVRIIDNNHWNPDTNFFLKLSVKDDYKDKAVPGEMRVIEIIIEDDDNPGNLNFAKRGYLFDGNKTGHIEIERDEGTDGPIAVKWKVTPGPLCKIVNPNLQGRVEFQHGEQKKIIDIPFLKVVGPLHGDDETFTVELSQPEGGAKLGKVFKTTCAVSTDEKYILEIRDVMSQALKISGEADEEISYCDQIKQSVLVNGGDTQNATAKDWALHLLTLPYKVTFSLIPPTHVWGGWPCFCLALVAVGLLTKLVGDAAGSFGVALGIDPTITAITIVALGTSLPDTFTSRIAAKNDRTADNAIGNITGSNSVNVFLGLGIPWTIGAIYYEKVDSSVNSVFCVPAGSLTFNVIAFSFCAMCAIIILTWRRFSSLPGNAELGGPTRIKWITALALVVLWFLYIALSVLEIVYEQSQKAKPREKRSDIFALVRGTHGSYTCLQKVEDGRHKFMEDNDN